MGHPPERGFRLLLPVWNEEIILRQEAFRYSVNWLLFCKLDSLRFRPWINVHLRTMQQPIVSILVALGNEHQPHFATLGVTWRAERTIVRSVWSQSPHNGMW